MLFLHTMFLFMFFTRCFFEEESATDATMRHAHEVCGRAVLHRGAPPGPIPHRLNYQSRVIPLVNLVLARHTHTQANASGRCVQQHHAQCKTGTYMQSPTSRWRRFAPDADHRTRCLIFLCTTPRIAWRGDGRATHGREVQQSSTKSQRPHVTEPSLCTTCLLLLFFAEIAAAECYVRLKCIPSGRRAS
jgi:hypothetical protein